MVIFFSNIAIFKHTWLRNRAKLLSSGRWNETCPGCGIPLTLIVPNHSLRASQEDFNMALVYSLDVCKMKIKVNSEITYLLVKLSLLYQQNMNNSCFFLFHPIFFSVQISLTLADISHKATHYSNTL